MDDTLNIAMGIINERRNSAEINAENKKNKIHKLHQDIAEVDCELEKTSKDIFAILFDSSSNLTLEDIKAKNLALQEKRNSLLTKYGYSKDEFKVKYFCTDCSDSGYVGLSMCHCLKKEIYRLRLENSEIGKLADKQSFDNFSFDYYPESAKAGIKFNYDTLKDFSEKFTSNTFENWLLVGDTGLGKTHLSTAVGVTIINKGYSVIYKSVQGIINDFEQFQFRHDANTDSSIVDKYYKCDLLIIDDLGVEMVTKFSLSCLYNILNTRLNNEKSMIINTNLNQTELRETYSDRITSRLFGEFKPLVFKGTDIRRLKLTK